jgi:hypothetical protein
VRKILSYVVLFGIAVVGLSWVGTMRQATSHVAEANDAFRKHDAEGARRMNEAIDEIELNPENPVDPQALADFKSDFVEPIDE